MQFTYVLGTLIGAFGQLEQITIIITFTIIITMIMQHLIHH